MYFQDTDQALGVGSRVMLARAENAIEHLLFGPQPLRRRLAEAYLDYLSPIPTSAYPTEELRKIAEAIQAAMTAYTLGNALDAEHGRIKAAMHLMTGSRARSVARLVFRLYTGLVQQALEES